MPSPDRHLDERAMTDTSTTAVAPTRAAALAGTAAGCCWRCRSSSPSSTLTASADGAAARRPDGPRRNVSRGRPRAGRTAARPRRRRGRGRRRRRRSNARRGRTPSSWPCRRSTSSTTTCCGGWPRVPGDRLLVEPIVADPGGARARGSPRSAGTRRRRARTATCGRPPRAGDVQFGVERHLRGGRRRAGDAVLRRRGGPLHRRRPHRHRGRQRRLHDQRGAAEARATPRWR